MKKVFLWSVALILIGGAGVATSAVVALNGIEKDVDNEDESVAVHTFFKKNFKSIDHEKLKWNGEELKVADDVHIKITGKGKYRKKFLAQNDEELMSLGRNENSEDSISYSSVQAKSIKIEAINPEINFQESKDEGSKINIQMSEKAKKFWRDSYVKIAGSKIEITTKEFEENCESENIDAKLIIVIGSAKDFTEIAVGLVNGKIVGTATSEKFLVVGVNADLELKVVSKETSINLVNGEIELNSDSGQLDIKSVNSDVKVTNSNIHGKANIKTVNGEILLEADEPMKSVDFHSVSGELKLKVSQPFEISGDFKEVNGKSTHGRGEVLKITGSCTFCELDVVSR